MPAVRSSVTIARILQITFWQDSFQTDFLPEEFSVSGFSFSQAGTACSCFTFLRAGAACPCPNPAVRIQMMAVIISGAATLATKRIRYSRSAAQRRYHIRSVRPESNAGLRRRFLRRAKFRKRTKVQAAAGSRKIRRVAPWRFCLASATRSGKEKLCLASFPAAVMPSMVNTFLSANFQEQSMS